MVSLSKRPRETRRPAPHQAPVTADPVKFDQAIRAFRDRVPVTRDDWKDLDADAREHSFTVGGVAQAEMVEQVWSAIDDAVANGTTFEDFQERVAAKLYESWGEEDPARLQTIFRTNVNQAYNDGREAIFSNKAVQEVRPFWRYELIDDDALCDECGECEDVTLPADDPWWDDHRPVLHPNCRCSFTALTREEAIEEGLIDPDADDADPEVAEGFGADRDEEYRPDLDNYADEIGEILGRVLDR